jgi:hypothetical protein
MSEVKYPEIYGLKTPPIKRRFWTFNLIEHVNDTTIKHPEVFIKILLPDDLEKLKEFTTNKEVKFSYTYDSELKPNTSVEIYRWLAEAFDISQKDAQPKEGWGNWGAEIHHYEQYYQYQCLTFNRVKPLSVHFGDLDYSSSSILTVEVTMKYDEMTCECEIAPTPPA